MDTIIIMYMYGKCCVPMFLISSYGALLAQRDSYLALHSSLFGAVNYDYIITNSITSLLIGSRCIPMAHTLTSVEPIWPMLQKLSYYIDRCIYHIYIMYIHHVHTHV